MLLCAAVAFNFAGFFIYVVSAPAFVYDILGLSETQFAWLFVPGVSGIMLGAFLSGRAAGRLSTAATVRAGYAVMFAAALFNIGYSSLAAPALPWSVLPVMVYTTGMALAMPSITLMALELHPAHRGMTASMQGFMQSFLSGVSAGALAPVLAGSPVTLAFGMTALLLAGWALWIMHQRIETGTTGHARA
jgi:DHA1 family bicyclomycin/chloramphenicol resistance-like MFS transporter